MTANVALSSRHRSNIATLFDVFCEIGTCSPGELPPVLTKYPEDYNDEAVLKSVRQFSFPCEMKEIDSEAVQLFSFVLTDSLSQYTFGYCRYTPRNNTCICLLSGFSWPSAFYKMLNHISLVMNTGNQDDLEGILTRIYHTDIPNIGETMQFVCQNGTNNLEVTVPDPRRLPNLREDRFMLEFYNAVSQRQMLAIYASLLKERRIIFTGRKLSQLSSCIYAASTLLYPMFWQSVFIPVLPRALSDMVMAPMPFLIGVPKQIFEASYLKELGDVVIVDLEDKSLESSHDDIINMPTEVLSYLKGQLKASSDMGDSLSRIFVRANVLLFGNYKHGLVKTETGKVIWDKDRFISSHKSSAQPYISSLLGADGVQYLERFIEERLKAINTGLPIVDEFEKEVANFEGRHKLQVKDNASDVIGALKEKVTGIQIGAKLNRLTSSKESKKSKNLSMKKNSSKSNINPLSFDNMQWQPPTGDSSSDRETSPVAPLSSSVPVANLIDFDSPIANNVNSLFEAPIAADMGSSRFYTDVVSTNPFRVAPTPRPMSVPVGMSSQDDPFFDPFRTPSTTSSPIRRAPPLPNVQPSTQSSTSDNAAATAKWEKFD